MKSATIYTLSDPRDNRVFYVGSTTLGLKNRTSVAYYGLPTARSLKDAGLRFVAEAIDECAAEERYSRERYWVEQFKSWGFRLENKVYSNPSLVNTPEKRVDPLEIRKKKVREEIFELLAYITPEDRKMAGKLKTEGKYCVSHYLSGKILDIDFACKLVAFFTERINARKSNAA